MDKGSSPHSPPSAPTTEPTEFRPRKILNFFQLPPCKANEDLLYYAPKPTKGNKDKDKKRKDKTMKTMMMTEDKGEALKVEAFFNEIKKSIEGGASYSDADCYCDETNSFTDLMEGGVDIPFGTLVYVYRDIGNGEAVWDIYDFGTFKASKDNEGDVAGLVNAGFEFFPF